MTMTFPTDWPRDPANERLLCTPEHPMPKGAEGRWTHSNVHEVGEQVDGWPAGASVRMKCDDCGHTWWMELPQ